MIPLETVPAIEAMLQAKTGLLSSISSTQMLGGGSINDACRLRYGGSDFFMKWNFAARYPGMFEAEARGLELLARAENLPVPEVIGTATTGKYAFLLLSYIASGRPDGRFWDSFGQSLAMLHRNSADMFGLDHENYIGSLPQKNTNHTSWADFYVEQRLSPQLRMACDSGLADKNLVRNFERLFAEMGNLFPEEPPSLVHGDLWSGNFMCNAQSEAVLIDPAVYYGHREMDIGMSKLFGGFSPAFYDAYNHAWPMEKGWQQRVHLCNLYPLLVHVNLFGGAYLSQVKSSLGLFI
jgi:protein-ribulosamine 3-kinase